MAKILDEITIAKNFKEIEAGGICKIGRDFFLKPSAVSLMAFPSGYNCICLNDGEFGYLKPEDKVTRVKEMEVVSYG